MTNKMLDLDNLVVGLSFPADAELGIPAGTITAVEHVACEDHNTEDGDGRGWYRQCHRCSVRRYEQLADGRGGWVTVDNRYLWTSADRAELGEDD